MLKSHKVWICALLLLSGGCATQQGSEARPPQEAAEVATVIYLDKPLFFQTPEHHPIQTTPGEYRIEETAEAQLLLLSTESSHQMVVAARASSHDLDLSSPFVLTFAEKEDELHILLLQPDGTARDAVGSLSGVQSRDALQAKRLYTMHTESGTVRFGDGLVGTTPPAAASTVSPSYRKGGGSAGNTGSGNELNTIELQTLLSDRQRALALTTAMLAAQNEHFHLEYNTNRPGGDYAQRLVLSQESCRTACAAEGTCQAFTFVRPAAGAAMGQCFLKRAVPASVANPCCISGKRESLQEEMIGNIR